MNRRASNSVFPENNIGVVGAMLDKAPPLLRVNTTILKTSLTFMQEQKKNSSSPLRFLPSNSIIFTPQRILSFYWQMP
jgi:hypothetical protein